MCNPTASKNKTDAADAARKLTASGVLKPAFSSHAKALWFVALIIFLLVLPKIIYNSQSISRRASYESMPEDMGAYSFMKTEVFDKKEDIDILFIGASLIWQAIDAPLVRQELSKKLGRPANVLVFGFNYNGFDVPYAILKDLLERRRVKLIILSIPRDTTTDGPTIPACKFIAYDDYKDIAENLPLSSKISLYACSVLRSPRDLLTIVRPNREAKSPYAEDLGAKKALLGMYLDPQNFEKFTPPPPVFPAASLIHKKFDDRRFGLTNDELPPYQQHYLNQMIELLKKREVPFAFINVPQYREVGSEKIIENQNWSEKFGIEITMIGIDSKTLFAGLSEKEIEKLHCDEDHFNVNGSEHFTRTILPAVLEVYETHAIGSF